MRAFPKPSEIEGIVTLTKLQMTKKRRELYNSQYGICACGCARPMTMELDLMDTCTVDHITPQPAGAKKQSADFNLRALRFDCNSSKGSRRR